jgi:hypothetical protein
LPIIGIKYLTQVFNAVLLKGYFLAQWKVTQVILLGNKPLTHRKVFEKLLPTVENNRLIPNHRFGFGHRHPTTEQTHRIVRWINEALENKQYCSAAFLDISQVIDKVWQTGLLYKLRRSLPLNYFLILKSYLHIIQFLIKVETEYTENSSV